MTLYDPPDEAVAVAQLLLRRERQQTGYGEVILPSRVIELDDTELRPGDVVLNFADPGFPAAAGSTHGTLTEPELLARLLAYVLLADRVFVQSRYVLDSDVLFNVLQAAPELLTSGAVVPERRATESSFEAVAGARALGPRGLARGRFLDEHALIRHPFQVPELIDAYRNIVLTDLDVTGPLSKMLPGAQRGRLREPLDRLLHDYRQSPGTLDDVLGSADRNLAGRNKVLVHQWLRARYYTTPALFDPVPRVRELPTPAATLLERGHVVAPWTGRGVGDPVTAYEKDIIWRLERRQPVSWKPVIRAVLEVKRQSSDAHRVFGSVVAMNEASKRSLDLSEAVADEFDRQRSRWDEVDPMATLTWGDVRDLSINAVVNIAAAALPLGLAEQVTVAASTTAGTGAAVAHRRYDWWKARKDAPWVVAHSRLRRALDQATRPIPR